MEMLVEMEEELKYAPAPFRNQMLSKLRSHKKDLVKLQREARSTDLGVGPGMASHHHNRGVYSLENEQSTHLQSQRALLYQGSDSLNRATESIARSHVLAAETDAVGTDIIEVLGEQREQLERSKGRARMRVTSREAPPQKARMPMGKHVPRSRACSPWKPDKHN
ncbi:hypothetical protein FKM82_016462 [Ascaphus truei]